MNVAGWLAGGVYVFLGPVVEGWGLVVGVDSGWCEGWGVVGAFRIGRVLTVGGGYWGCASGAWG